MNRVDERGKKDLAWGNAKELGGGTMSVRTKKVNGI